MKIVAIQGSVRPRNNTAAALGVVADIVHRIPNVTLEIIDPTEMTLNLPGKGNSEDAQFIQKRIAAADGVILATPEYHGSYSSVMKLVIDNLGFPSRLKGKPVALIGVAAGRIGAIKALEHLRSVASHVGALVLPGPVSIANVRKMFDEQGALQNDAVRDLLSDLTQGLVDYVKLHVCPLAELESFSRKAS